MNTMDRNRLACARSCLAALILGWAGLAQGQFDTGSDGSDGVFSPQSDIVIDMTDHPDGVYQYESVNIPEGVTVSFTRNAENTPVTWLVQTTCVIDGTVSVNGMSSSNFLGGEGGPGGFNGGNGAPFNVDSDPGPGQGPGGALVVSGESRGGGGGSYGGLGGGTSSSFHPRGPQYGSIFLLPLIGGSGGGGGGRTNGPGGGGGGGAILIAASTSITVNGLITAKGGNHRDTGFPNRSGGGSGGAIRLATPNIIGTGMIDASGGTGSGGEGGNGRVRLEGRLTSYTGTVLGAATAAGGAGILILPDNLQPDLAITSVAGIAAPPNPTGDLANPDILIPITETNPMEIIVACQDLLPGTDVVVTARPEFGAVVSAMGDAEGTFDDSTATVLLDVPAGVGLITAQAVNGVGAEKSEEVASRQSPGVTGMASNGERFVRVEMNATYGGRSETVLITESGLRLPLPRG